MDRRPQQQLMIDRVLEEHGDTLDYTLLSDPDHAVIARYGLLNEGALPDRHIPHPTTLVIDEEGVVRWKRLETDYTVRPSNDEILAAVEALGRPEGG